MPEHERQRYVAYRASSDEYEVEFFGGPLDGALMSTDIFPDDQTFVHRVRDQSYFYRYRRVSELQFHATLAPSMNADSLSASQHRVPRLAVIASTLLLAALLIIASL